MGISSTCHYIICVLDHYLSLQEKRHPQYWKIVVWLTEEENQSPLQKFRSMTLLIISQFLVPSPFTENKNRRNKNGNSWPNCLLSPLNHLSIPICSLPCLILSDTFIPLLKALFIFSFQSSFITVGIIISLKNKICTGLPNKNKLFFILKGVVDS